MRIIFILSLTLIIAYTANVTAQQGYCPSCGEVIDTSFDYDGNIQVYKSSEAIVQTDKLAYSNTNEMTFQITTQVTIGGVELMALVDTGATHSVVSYETFRRMRDARYLGTRTGATMTNEINVVFYDVTMEQAGISVIDSIGVIPKDKDLLINADAIIGFSTLRKLGLNVDVAGGKVYR